MRQQTFPRLGRAAAALLCAAVLVVACDSPTGTDRPGAPARLDVVSGDLQTAEVGTELAQPLVVRVVDANGTPLAGQIVNFRVVSGGGSVFAGAAQTNADGMAQERWTLGNVARDTQRVEARAVDPVTGQALVFATFRAVGRAGAPAGISPVGSAARTGSAGAALGEALQARVTDRFGNPVPAAAVVWTVRSGGGSVTPGTSTADSLGIASAIWTLGARVDSAQVVEAAASVAVKTAFTATAALPLGSAVVKVSGDGQTATVGAPLAQPLKVAVLLPGGQPAVGATVTWSVGAGSGTITPLVSVTDANGQATAQWTLGTAPGAQSASASVAGAGTATFAATAVAGPAAALVKVSGDGQSAPAGTTLPAQLVAKVVDAYGNPVPGAPLAWAVTAGGGSVTPTSGTTGAAGTGSTAWTLGPAAGAQAVRVTSGALAADFTATAGSAYSLTWFQPAVGTVAGDSVYVLVRGSSTDLVSATATVEDRTVQLRLTSGPEFSGWVPLAGLTPGTKELVVRALAANGDSAVARRTFVHDQFPGLTVAPLDGTVARPELRVDADCTDDAGPCTVGLYLEHSTTPLVSGTSGLHTTVSLAAYEAPPWSGRATTARVRATDSRGQFVEQVNTVFVESSPRWTEVATAPDGWLWDFDAARLLYVTSFGQLSTFEQRPSNADVRIRDRASGTEATLGRFATGIGFDFSRMRGYLHPQGAIFMGDGVYDWRAGTLEHLPGSGLITVEGNWAVWEGYRRDLAAGTTVLFGSDSQAPDVAANGDVVYGTVHFTNHIFRYRGGATEQLTNEDSVYSYGPVTDGINVAFTRQSKVSPLYQVILIAPDGSRVELVGRRPQLPQYAVENGWAAYDLYDASAIAQIWVRAPDGTIRQATHASSRATIVALGPNGELVYDDGWRRYVVLAPYTGTPVDIGNARREGWVRWRDGGLYVTLGRSAFQVSY
jgi:hypothetical protein